MKKILITGINSLLGKYLVKNLRDAYEIYGFYHQNPIDIDIKIPQNNLFFCDITNASTTKQLIHKIKPKIIIHLAALSNIDFCENHPQKAKLINVHGTQNIIQAIKNTNSYLIFISSNAIFSGKNAPYKEQDIPHPINIYGQTKYEAEKLVIKSRLTAVIIRCSTIFGYPPLGARENDVTYYSKLILKNKPIHLVTDRFFKPIYSDTVAKIIKQIINLKLTGILHLSGYDRINRYMFVKKIMEVFFPNSKCILIPVKSSYFPKIAPRPVDITLNVNKLKKLLKFSPQSLKSELAQMKTD